MTQCYTVKEIYVTIFLLLNIKPVLSIILYCSLIDILKPYFTYFTHSVRVCLFHTISGIKLATSSYSNTITMLQATGLHPTY